MTLLTGLRNLLLPTDSTPRRTVNYGLDASDQFVAQLLDDTGAAIVVGKNSSNGGTLILRANATAYTSGKIIAQSATAAQCAGVPIAVARAADKGGMIRRVRLKINSATWLNAIIRVHLFKDTPTFTNADNGNFAAGVTESNYLGYADVTLDQSFSDPFVKGVGAPAAGGEFNFEPSSGTQYVYAVLQARSAVNADAASQTFTVTAECLQN